MENKEYLSVEYKKAIFEQYSKGGATDTGSPEAQVALFTKRISHLTEHLKKNKKDNASRLGLLKLVGKRRKLLSYLAKKDINRYRAIIKELGIRK
ncbi:30S ribosomal protein S15 [Limibacter armeniacum]|uniref:30S ribosomal protein S15 n=1 Tax=Limibacter armeniacum TaxID=466084 RepID=UPI002FE54D87